MHWSSEQVPADHGRESILHTVTEASGTAWAFGISPNQHGQFDTLAFRRDSDGWQPVAVPSIGRANRAIAIDADDVWAVGDDNMSLHHHDGRWQPTPTAALDHAEAQLFGLTQFGGHDIWAAGYAPDPDCDRGRGTVQQHWDGQAWTDQPLPSVATNWGLSGVGGIARDDVWAVGTVFRQPARAVILHYDGSGWLHVPAPAAPNTEIHLTDVVALTGDDVWAGGYRTLFNRGRRQPRQPLAMHWDGTAWSITDLDDREGPISQLVAADGRVFGIGYAGAEPFVTALTGSILPTQPGLMLPTNPNRSSLHGAAMLAGGVLLAVGAAASPEMPVQPLALLGHP